MPKKKIGRVAKDKRITKVKGAYKQYLRPRAATAEDLYLNGGKTEVAATRLLSKVTKSEENSALTHSHTLQSEEKSSNECEGRSTTESKETASTSKGKHSTMTSASDVHSLITKLKRHIRQTKLIKYKRSKAEKCMDRHGK